MPWVQRKESNRMNRNRRPILRRGTHNVTPLPLQRCGTPCQVVKRTFWVVLCLIVIAITIPASVSLGKLTIQLIGDNPWASGTIVDLLPAGQDPSLEEPGAACDAGSEVCAQLASVTVYLASPDFNITDTLARCSTRHPCNQTYRMGDTVWVTNSPELGVQVIKDPGLGVLLVGNLGFVFATVWALLLCVIAIIYFVYAVIRGFCDPFPSTFEYPIKMETMLADEESIEPIDVPDTDT